MHRLQSVLLLALLLASAGCTAPSEDAWAFGISRSVYGSHPHRNARRGPPPEVPSDCDEGATSYGPSGQGVRGTTDSLWVVPLVIGLPVLVDLALLPVTLTHDLFFAY